ncbi:hypothetical protein MXM45_22685 [Citrobacter cronae]|uniref:hypothetical protein n=1 Tax=Citrobacter cronae TaxID=1748967 RepID=UPI002DBDE637|nr:hypothetical protein [Citrobacter cronae]MEB5757115.1 hypothetical protein [Citrobacter cronae]
MLSLARGILSRGLIAPSYCYTLRVTNKLIQREGTTTMFLLNNRDRILKYKDEVILCNHELIAKVAEMAGCTVEEIEKAVEQYFPSENTNPNKLSIQERIANKVKKESTKQ